MKDPKSKELERFQVPVLGNYNVATVTKHLFPNSNVLSFDFPSCDTEDTPTLLTFVTYTKEADENLLIRLTTVSHDSGVMRALSPSEIYTIQDRLMYPNETLVWMYHEKSQAVRSQFFKKATNSNFDMTNFVLHMSEYKAELPPLKEIYSKKVQKNRGYTYTRGTIRNWRYILVQTKNPFPWTEFQLITKREFGRSNFLVFFNEETKKHPNQYVVVENPFFFQV